MTDSAPAGSVLAAADQVEAVAAAYVDRVHDLVRRCGCAEPAATEIVGTTLLDLVDAVAGAPCPETDAVGGWFAASRALASGLSGEPAADGQEPAAPDGAVDDARVEGALLRLPGDERTALLLRDHYDLPFEVAAAVLGIGVEDVAGTVARGRLQLFADVCGRSAADLDGHRPHPAADPAVLGRLADGTVPPARWVPVSRHVAACAECGDVVNAQHTARRLVAGLPLIAMEGEERTAVIDAALGRAAAALPASAGAVQPRVSPFAVFSLLVLAALAGLLAGLVTAH